MNQVKTSSRTSEHHECVVAFLSSAIRGIAVSQPPMVGSSIAGPELGPNFAAKSNPSWHI
jgi:hypothetical protein